MFDQLLENTILLFVAVDPIALVPIFASLTQGLNKDDIKKSLHSSNYSFFFCTIVVLYVWNCNFGSHGHLNELI
jgi:small neutral amino acid transporter SnatA (MarC family)